MDLEMRFASPFSFQYSAYGFGTLASKVKNIR